MQKCLPISHLVNLHDSESQPTCLVLGWTYPDMLQTRAYDSSFAVMGPKLWNVLPASLTMINSAFKFTAQLTRMLYILEDKPPTVSYARAHSNSLPEVMRRAEERRSITMWWPGWSPFESPLRIKEEYDSNLLSRRSYIVLMCRNTDSVFYQCLWINTEF